MILGKTTDYSTIKYKVLLLSFSFAVMCMTGCLCSRGAVLYVHMGTKNVLLRISWMLRMAVGDILKRMTFYLTHSFVKELSMTM